MFHRKDSTTGSRKRGLALLAASLLGWFLTLGSLQAWLDIRSILAEDDRWLREEVVFLSPEIALADTVGLRKAVVGEDRLERIRATPGVLRADPVLRNRFPLVVRIGGGAFPSLVSEIFLEALHDEHLETPPGEWKWNEGEPVPLLLPRLFLHLYNFGFAPGKGLPPVSEGAAARVPIELVAHSRQGGSPVSFPATIAGFSDRINAPLAPASFLETANQRFAHPDGGFGRNPVAVADADATTFLRALEETDLEASGGSGGARLRFLLDMGTALLGGTGLVILALNLLLAHADSEAFLDRNRADILRLYFLGHSPAALLRRILPRRLPTLLLPAVGSLALLAGLRPLYLENLAEVGLNAAPWPSPATLLLAALLAAAGASWFTIRLRTKLRKLYR